MLSSVRPLMMQRWSSGPVWEFADRNQIINACSGHDEYTWFSGPVSPTVAPYPPSTDYTSDDLRPAKITPWLRPALCNSPALQVAPQTIPAILLASATVTSTRGLRANICSSHDPLGAPRLLAWRTTALLPMMMSA